MKKIMIMGAGAQGSTIAKRMQEEPSLEEIVCADYDMRAAQELEKALPACYQDLASGPVEDEEFIDAVRKQFGRDQEFKDAGLAALTNTGSAPGVANVVTREAVDKFDSVDTIEILVYEGIWSKRFIPFWWSPDTAFGDMAADPVVFRNGKFEYVPPFNDPTMVEFRGLGTRRMYDHEHEEPVTMGLMANKYLKGVKNVSFRYGGPACELAKSLNDMGLLSSEPVEVDGAPVVPMHLISRLTPPAPKYREEIQEVLDEGLEMEEGAFLVRVDGKKDGEDLRIDSYVNAPGLRESFAKAGISHESYYTGQGASLFTKMLVNGKIDLKGVFPPEALGADARAYYLREAAKLDITVDEIIQRRVY